MTSAKSAWVVLLAASLAGAAPVPRVRSLQGLEEEQAAVHARPNCRER